MRAFSGHSQADEDLVNWGQREVTSRRARWKHLSLRIESIEWIRLLLASVDGTSEALQDDFHLVRYLNIGRIIDGVLQKATSEDGMSGERRFPLVLRLGGTVVHLSDAFVGRIMWK